MTTPMEFPMPVFKVGEVVWRADVGTIETSVTCPDCLGEKTWRVTTPAGEEFHVPCETCRVGEEATGLLSESRLGPLPHQEPIGAILVDTGDVEDPIRYELGARGGSLVPERDVFQSHDPAYDRSLVLLLECHATQTEKSKRTHRNRRRRVAPMERWKRNRDALIKLVREGAPFDKIERMIARIL